MPQPPEFIYNDGLSQDHLDDLYRYTEAKDNYKLRQRKNKMQKALKLNQTSEKDETGFGDISETPTQLFHEGSYLKVVPLDASRI